MKKLYLASSIETSGQAVVKDITDDTGKDSKSLKLVFINTAGEVDPDGETEWMDEDRNGLLKSGIQLDDYTITGKSPADFDKDLTKYDIIHVNGGNTFYLLLQSRKSGFDKWIKKVVLSGEKIYTGSSAGSLATAGDLAIARIFQDEDIVKELKTYEGFGLVDFVAFPHWGNKDFRESYLNLRMEFAYKPENKLILLNNWQYIKVEGYTYKIMDIRD